jgi:hypothetical protein
MQLISVPSFDQGKALSLVPAEPIILQLEEENREETEAIERQKKEQREREKILAEQRRQQKERQEKPDSGK